MLIGIIISISISKIHAGKVREAEKDRENERIAKEKAEAELKAKKEKEAKIKALIEKGEVEKALEETEGLVKVKTEDIRTKAIKDFVREYQEKVVTEKMNDEQFISDFNVDVIKNIINDFNQVINVIGSKRPHLLAPDDYFYRGFLYYYQRNQNKSFEDYSKCIKMSQVGHKWLFGHRLCSAYNNRGNILQRYFKDYSKALDDYNNAIKWNPNLAMTYVNRGTLYSNGFNDYKKALDDYNKAIKLDSNLGLAYNNRGVLYWKVFNNYTKAMVDYNRAIKVSPNLAKAYNNRSVIYNRVFKDLKKALEDLNKAIKLNPKFYDAYLNRGILFKDSLKKYNKALSDFNTAIKININLPKAYYDRASLFKIIENFDNALDDYNKAIEIDKFFADAYTNRGLLYVTIYKEYIKAMNDFTKAIEINPDKGFAYYTYSNRGYLYEILGIYNKALLDYNKSIALNPNWANSRLSRGKIYFLKNEFRKALKDFEKALEFKLNKETEFDIQDKIGHVCLKLLECDKAIDSFEKCIQINPFDKRFSLYNIACAYSLKAGIEKTEDATKKDIEKAIYYLKEAIKNGFRDFEQIKKDTDLDNIRDHPKFKKLLKEKK